MLCYVSQGVNADWLLCYVPQGVNAVGVVVFNPHARKSHCLPFLGQENTILEMYVTIRLHIYDPVSIQIHVFTGEILL